MIIPSRPPSQPDQDPPPYQESQRLPSERGSFYAPPISSRQTSRAEELGPDPDEATETTSLMPPTPPPKDKEKGTEKDNLSQVWDTKSPPPDPASTSHASPTQDPLHPAPEAFTRPTAKEYEYSTFHPVTMLGISSNLADGFPMIPPPINPEDERGSGKGPDHPHPFVSHDVTEDDWLKFLAGLKTVASTPAQTQRSFFARMFLSEMNEKDQRKRAVHFINSWNHYFFQPRRMSVVLARGRKIYGAVDHNQRRHSISADRERGRDTDSTRTGDRRRSRSSDSSSSRRSAPSVRSAASEPPEMPASQTHEPPSEKAPAEGYPQDWWKMNVGSAVVGGVHDVREGVNEGLYNSRYGLQDGLYHLQYGVGLGLYNLRVGLNEGFYHVNNGLQSAFGGQGPNTLPQVAGPSTGEPSKPLTESERKEAWKAQVDAWKVEQDEWKRQQDARKQEWENEQKALRAQGRGVKPERKLTKEAPKEAPKEKEQQQKPEDKGKCRDQPWKLIIFYHDPRRETEHL